MAYLYCLGVFDVVGFYLIIWALLFDVKKF